MSKQLLFCKCLIAFYLYIFLLLIQSGKAHLFTFKFFELFTCLFGQYNFISSSAAQPIHHLDWP